MSDESYTFEDYLKDFELDYLGFDGVPHEAVPDQCSEKTAENDTGTETGESGGNKIAPDQQRDI